MPSRNVTKQHKAESYYHVYARRASKEPLFVDENDYLYFINLFQRYLSKEPTLDSSNVAYRKHDESIELLAYCLMSNHFHLFIYQEDAESMARFMKSVMTSYSMYFNKRHNRTGPLFESRYKASRIDNEAYLLHISRYVHLNPRYWQRYPYSSVQYYISSTEPPSWLKTKRINDLFTSPAMYKQFLTDYEDKKLMIDEIKYQLADQ